MEKGKKKVWHSPESCDLKDNECILTKINELAKNDLQNLQGEIIMVSDMPPPHPDDLPMRIGIVKKSRKEEKNAYSTHWLLYDKNKEGNPVINLGSGHYDLDIESALKDFERRETQLEKPFTHPIRKKGFPPLK